MNQLIYAFNSSSVISSQPHLVFIDARVEDYASLASGVNSETEVFVLNLETDGVSQVTEILATRQNLKTLHLVTHGSPGCLYLGNGQLSTKTLDDYAQQLRQWRKAFDDDAEILIYGCRAAADSSFVQQLHHLTGATVAASATPTGNRAKGGNWQLEVSIGEVSSSLAFSMATQAAYTGVLETKTLTVDTTEDENDGGYGGAGLSLRDAILIADADNDSSNQYVIELTGGQTYELDLVGDGNTLGDLDFDEADITIVATGTEKATIQASNNDRVFELEDANLTLKNLIVTGGDSGSSNGGAIDSSDSNVTIENSEFKDNKAGQGGAIQFIEIFREEISLDIKNSLFSGNRTTDSGGALEIAGGKYTIDETTITNNVSQNQGGGGITISSLQPGTISNSLISNNTAQSGKGGGISHGGGELTLNDTKIIGNQTDENGGGIDQSNANAQLIVNGGEISNNSAGFGGGVYIAAGTAEFNDTLIKDNEADSAGGAYIGWTAEAHFQDLNIINNTARTDDGGGGYSQGTLTLNNVNHSENESGKNGAGWQIVRGDVEILNSLFKDNFAGEKGGAVNVDSTDLGGRSEVNVQGSTFENNEAVGSGGAVNVKGGFSDTASSFRSSAGKFIASYSTFANNVSGETGGAINNNGILDLNYTTISGNSAAADGGGIAASDGAGGVVPCTDSPNACSFAEAEASTTAVKNSTVAKNQAGGDGGNIYTPSNTQVTSQSEVYIYYGKVSLLNTIVADGVDNSAAQLHPDVSGKVYANYSLIENTSGTTIDPNNNVINQDPLLEPLQNNGGATMTHNLQAGSAAIGAGKVFNPNEPDQNGNLIGNFRDIGSTQFTDDGGQNNVPGITVSPDSGLVTSEAGGTDSFSVVLNTQPTADVTIEIISSDTTEGTTDEPFLTFTSNNFNTPQTVTVIGVDDNLVDGSINYSIITAAAISGDPDYNELNAVDVSVTNTDNDGDGTNGQDITGTSGSDNLTGTDSGDRLMASPGRDRLTSLGGSDEYIYTSVVQAGDLLVDFEVGDDVIVLTEMLASLGWTGSDPIADGVVQFGARSSGTLLEIDADGLAGSASARPFLLVEGISVDQLNDAGNFVF